MRKKTNGSRPAAKPHPARIGLARTDCEGAEQGRRIGARTLGPVSDLKRHLPSDWWRTLFNSLYLETDGDVIENDRNTGEEVDLLVRTVGLERDNRILDLCCGQGRHSLELAGRGFIYVTGLDRSRYLIRLARKRAKQRDLQVSFHEGDARRFRLAEAEFDCVCLLGNSFGYFERPEDDLAVLEAVKRALASGGALVMDLMDGEWMRSHFEARSWEWVDQNHFVCRERELTEDGDRLISREVVVHAERGVIADQFYAERLYSKERLDTLLTSAGFTNVRFHPLLAPDSPRNQDLGMVAHRLFVTCEAPRRVQRLLHRAALFSDITVLLGDPRLPDPVKRDGRFSEEDIETIDRLMAALDELPDYRFRFLDNHASLYAELRANHPHFVLNFCDEGFNNDAFMELHVPALLEMLDIPYSGAGPACLGLCYNKSLVRGIAQAIDVPVPAETYFNSDDLAATIPSVFPALIKLNFGDSSIGITKDAVVHTWEEAITCLGRLREEMPRCPILIQEFLTGPEYSIGIIGNPGLGYRVLPPIEVDYSRLDPALPRLLPYEFKVGPRLALLVADQLSRGPSRRGITAQDRRLREYFIRAARLPRLRALRFSRRRRGRDQAARGQSKSGLVLGRQAQPDGRTGRAALLGAVEADHRDRRGPSCSTTPRAGHPVHHPARTTRRCTPRMTKPRPARLRRRPSAHPAPACARVPSRSRGVPGDPVERPGDGLLPSGEIRYWAGSGPAVRRHRAD